MNHLAAPIEDPLQVPYLCDALTPCDEHTFMAYPDQYNIDVEELVKFDDFGERAGAMAGFLQAWLFFGLMRRTFGLSGIIVDVDDFLDGSEQGSDDDADDDYLYWITTEGLPTYIIYWVAKETHETDEQRKENIWNGLTSTFTLVNRVINELVSYRSRRYEVEVEGSTELPALERVILSIILLSEYLLEAACRIFEPPVYWQLDWNLDNALRYRLSQAGWCPGEIKLLFNRAERVSSLYILSSFDRRTVEKDHTQCKDVCTANFIDEHSYQTRHVSEQCECEFLGEAATPEAIRLLDDEDVPVIRVHPPRTSKGPVQISVGSTLENSRSYVAISHVWSDGLGNPKSNSLPQCQLRRLQSMVNRLYDRASWPVPFWIDTLCVPLQNESRKKAIRKMGQTYREADKVLVLDSWLMQSTMDYDPGELNLLRVKFCTWTQRLWTLQEAMIARDERLHFQSIDGPVSEERLRGSDRETPYPSIELVNDLIGNEDDTLQERHPDLRDRILDIYRRLPTIADTIANLENPLRMPTELRKDSSMLSLLDSWHSFSFSYVEGRDYLLELRWMGRRAAAQPDDEEASVNDYALVGQSMRNRSTTKLGDEAICLATLLRQDVRQLFEVDDAQERMKMILDRLSTVAYHTIFSDSPRINEDGYRWAARTFLTSTSEPSPGTVINSRGVVTPEGLEVKLEGVLLDTGSGTALVRPPEGFTLLLGNRRVSVTFPTAEPPLLEVGPNTPLAIVLELMSENLGWRTVPGALVVVNRVSDDMSYVRFIAVVSLQVKGAVADAEMTRVSGHVTEKQSWCVG